VALQAANAIKRSALGWVLRHASVVAFLVIVLVSGTAISAWGVALANLVAAALVTCWLTWTIWRVALWPPSYDPEVRRRLVAFSVPLIAFTVSQYIMASVDLIVIGVFSGAEAAGIYAVAYQGYAVLQGIAGACVPVLVPLLVSIRFADREELVDRYFTRVMPQLVFLGSCLVGLAATTVPLLLPTVLGDAFAGAAQPLVVLLAALLMFFAASLLAPIMMLHERTRTVGAVALRAALFNVVADLVLIGALDLGIWAAAAATAAAVALLWAGYLAECRRSLPSNAVPNPSLFLPAVAGLVPALALPAALALPVGSAVVLTTAAIVLRLVKPFRVSDVDAIRDLRAWAPIERIATRLVALSGQPL